MNHSFLKLFFYVFVVMACIFTSTNTLSNFGNQESDEVLFSQFKKYLSYLSLNDLNGLDELSSSIVPYTEGQLNIEMGEPEKNLNFIQKPFTDGKVKFSKKIWNRVRHIYGYKVETISNKIKILILHAKGLGDNKDKKKNIKIRFILESGTWKINEIEHTLESHSQDDFIFLIDLK